MVFKARALISGLLARLGQGAAIGQAMSALMSRTLAAGLAYLFQIYLANVLKIDAYGIFVSFWTWQLILSNILVLGYQESAVRFLPRYATRNQQQHLQSFVREGAKNVLIASSLVGVFGFAAIWQFGDQLNEAYFGPALVLVLGMPIIAMEVYLEGVNRGLGWYLLSIVPSYILRPIAVVAVMFGLSQTGWVLDAQTALAVMVAVTLILLVGQTLIMLRRMRPQGAPKKRKSAREKRLRRAWILATLPLVVVSGIDEMLYWSDILVLGFLAEPADVSVYFAAIRCMAFATFIHYGFMLVFAREFSLANAGGDLSELRSRISMASTWTFWLTIPAVVMIVAAGPILLSFFGEAFAEGIVVMVVIGIGIIGKSAVGPASNLLIVLGKEKRDVMISAISLVANVLISIALVPVIGILGAALGTAASQLVRALLLARYCRMRLDLNVTTHLDPRVVLARS
jgi:O-antigen/teichoic acid export membrane protein